MLQNIEEYLQVAVDQGYADAYLEMMGGGIMCVWIPLDHPVYEYALFDYMGIGLYAKGWDGDIVPMYDFDDEQENPTYWQALDAFEWMEKTLKAEAN